MQISEIHFEWDSDKARANVTKHGVSFEEAATAFYDEFGLLLDDPDYSEDRFVLIGLSSVLRVLVIAHCFFDATETIRIISARRATRSETTFYMNQRQP